ncbi:hypothetical protein OG361_22845 [Streptomyces sp. NBC_00090]
MGAAYTLLALRRALSHPVQVWIAWIAMTLAQETDAEVADVVS